MKTRCPRLRISACVLISFVTLLLIVVLCDIITSTYKLNVMVTTSTTMRSDMLRALYDGLFDYINRNKTHNDIHHIVIASNCSQKSFYLDKEFNNTAAPFDILWNALSSSKKSRQITFVCCFKHTLKYVIENDGNGQEKSETGTVTHIVIILATHMNFIHRNAIRRTWLTYTKNNTGKERYAFLIR